MKIYGVSLLVWSLLVLVASFTCSLFESADIAFAIMFVLTVISICPAIVTYTKCGLNSDESVFRPRDKSVDAKHQIMQNHFAHWKTAQNTFFAAITIAFALSIVMPSFVVNPFLFFVGSLGLLAATWSIFAYPVAKTLLESSEKE